MYKFEWDGKELMRFVENLSEENFENAILDSVKESGDLFLKTVRNRTPVDTGNLKADWSRNGNLSRMPKREGDSYSIEYQNAAINYRGTSPAIYASFVEEGYHTTNGRWIPGHWFAKASEIKTAERVPTIVNRHLRRWIDRGVGND